MNSGGLPSIAATMTTDDDEKDDADLYTMPEDDYDKTDEGGVSVIVEEEPGTVVLKPATESGKGKKKGVEALLEVDEEASDDDKEDDMEYEDAYEQEV